MISAKGTPKQPVNGGQAKTSLLICYVISQQEIFQGMTKYRKGPQRTHKRPTKDPQRTAKEHYTGPQRIGNHEKTARLATILFNF